jgi:4-hydroxybenzoate polyprenyltransferase
MGNGLYNFLGSLLVLLLAILIFFTLMSSEMPDKNRELLIAFISVLFGGMAASIKNIIGDKSEDKKQEDTENKNL